MPEWFFAGVIFIFGLVIGSFLNVVAYRFHTGKSLNGHSHCESCGTRLSWYDLFPVFSYLSLRGRCRYCGSLIRPQHALIEAATGLLFLIAYFESHDLILLALSLAVIGILMVTFVYDVRHLIIPDELSFALAGVGALAALYVAATGGGLMSLLHAVLGAGAAFMFFGTLWWISGGRWLGFGDAKLSVGLGLLVGLSGVFSLVVWSFWIGAGISLSLMALERLHQRHDLKRLPSVTMKSEIPFAPFLIISFFLVYFFGADVLGLIDALYGSF